MIYSGQGQTDRSAQPGTDPADLRAITEVSPPPLCPELRVPSLPSGLDFDSFRSANAALLGAGVPYWAVAWPGGQALARFLLDRPAVARGRDVVDLGCGNGMAAVAAALDGAASVIAVDEDPNALSAAQETARLNGAEIDVRQESLERFRPAPRSLICAGDLWYDRETARRATAALRRLAADGHEVYCGDPGRAERPRLRIDELARYDVAASQAFERGGRVQCAVFQLLP